MIAENVRFQAFLALGHAYSFLIDSERLTTCYPLFLRAEYITTESFTDVVELLIPELQKRGIYHTEYPVPGGTLRENLYRKKGQNLVPDDHPAHPYKWNVRETNHKSAWDLRENGAELAAAAAAADDRADEQEANTNGSHAVNGTSFVIGNGVKEAP